MGINIKKYNIIQATYSLPNIVSPFIAGMVIDKLGFRIGMIGYSTLAMIGMAM